jgi:hypothetical protein
VACVTAARWEPDGQLVAAVLSSPRARRMANLPAPDRCWVVAGLTLAGLTAKDIAERLGCSLRLVRSIRAEPMTQVCLLMQRESRNFSDELRLKQSEHQVTRHHLSDVTAAADRYKRQLDNVLDKIMIGEPVTTCRKCNTPMDKWNTYEHRGKRWCRECRRVREADRRARLSRLRRQDGVDLRGGSSITTICIPSG